MLRAGEGGSNISGAVLGKGGESEGKKNRTETLDFYSGNGKLSKKRANSRSGHLAIEGVGGGCSRSLELPVLAF